MSVSLSRNTSFTMFSHDRSASVPASPASFGFIRRACRRSPSSACFATAPLRPASALAGSYPAPDVVELDVEDEDGVARPLLERGGSAASTGSTSKNRPNTAFIARSDAAIPPLVRRKSRRLSPSRGASRPASARIRSSTARCAAVCGSGGNSSLETRRVGSGTSLRKPRRMPGRMRKAWRLSTGIVASLALGS
jgi:hypothetical protein